LKPFYFLLFAFVIPATAKARERSPHLQAMAFGGIGRHGFTSGAGVYFVSNKKPLDLVVGVEYGYYHYNVNELIRTDVNTRYSPYHLQLQYANVTAALRVIHRPVFIDIGFNICVPLWVQRSAVAYPIDPSIAGNKTSSINIHDHLDGAQQVTPVLRMGRQIQVRKTQMVISTDVRLFSVKEKHQLTYGLALGWVFKSGLN
jgi:hypothetical protein